MKWPEVDALSRDVPLVLPIAALEQHGRHLPLFVDSLLLEEIVRQTEAQLEREIVFAPVMWLGNSGHHLDFPGSMSAGPRTYLDLLRDMIDCFLRHGFRRIVLLNSHGGNSVPAQQALYEARQAHRDESDLLLLLANYWALGSPSRDLVEGIVQPAILHACQWETAMTMHLHPELVAPVDGIEDVDPGNPFQPGHRASTMRDVTPFGHVGMPRAATKEIGEELLSRYVADVVMFLRRVTAWDGRSWSG